MKSSEHFCSVGFHGSLSVSSQTIGVSPVGTEGAAPPADPRHVEDGVGTFEIGLLNLRILADVVPKKNNWLWAKQVGSERIDMEVIVKAGKYMSVQ